MTLLQSRKSKQHLISVWDIAVRSVTGSAGVRPGIFGPKPANSPENPGYMPGAFHFWKRRGWRFYPVNTRYFIPTRHRTGQGFPITVLAIDPTNSAADWLDLTGRLSQAGEVVVAVELSAAGDVVAGQAALFLEAAWTAIALKIGGLAASPLRLSWWGTGEAAAVVERAALLTTHKYYLPPDRVITRAFNPPDPAQPAETAVTVVLAKAS